MTGRLVWSGIVCSAAALVAASQNAEAAPRKIFAISQQQPGGLAEVPGNPSDTILLYDVTDIGTAGAANVFNNEPLFSVWLGYEIFEGEVGDVAGGMPRGNREDTSAITFNPANGTIYAAAFDSSSPGTAANPNNPDAVGDNQGDFDLYRIDYQELLADFIDNNRPKGTVYAPPTQRISTANEQFLAEISSPLFDGTVDGIAHNIPHPGALTTTVFIDDAILKTGELGRSQSATSFFDTRIDFVTPEKLVLLDTAPGTDVAGDFQIRAWQRVSTSPGAATIDFDGADNATGPPGTASTYDDQLGGRNGNSVESWEASIMGRLELDSADRSEPTGWSLVKANGKIGLWVADSDAGGDELAYFELDFSGSAPSATKKTLAGSAFPQSLRMDEDPTVDASTDDGEIDYLAVDKDGNLIIGESGFFDTIEGSMTPPTGSGLLTAQQPRVATIAIESYDGAVGEILPEGYTASGGTIGFDSPSPWSVSPSVAPTETDDSQVLGGTLNTGGTAASDATKVAYDRSTGWVFFIDSDQDFVEDIYVFDPATGQIIYQEIDAFNPGLFNQGTQIVFTRGDINGDGVVNQADVASLQAGIADPTLGGTVSAAVGAEWYDLTGDGLLTAADLAELNSLIGAPLAGDFNGDQTVNGLDLTKWKNDFGQGAMSDADGDGDTDGADFLIWQRNFGATASSSSASAVPEPHGAALLAAAGAALLRRRRRAG